MEVQPDYRELLALLNEHGVEYMIVGGYALAYHGAPRYTADLDVFVKPDPENSRRIIEALNAFGFEAAGLTPEDFRAPEKVVQLGVPPVRVDILTSLTGVSWEEAFSGRTEATYGDVPVYFIGRAHLVANKRALGRKRDFADIEALGEE
jgi:hypothetical protein